MPREAGVLAHPTSLPGRFGIGDLGPEAVRFLDWAAEAGLKVWQVLPLGPIGPHGSPYSSPSAFAGNPLLISPERLAAAGWLPRGRVEDLPPPAPGRVDFDRVAAWKGELLRESWECFQRTATSEARRELEAFAEDGAQTYWLDDWVLYAALKRRFGGRPWTRWDADLRARNPLALDTARLELSDEIAFHRYLQFVFFHQWEALRAEATARGLTLFGDVPFYVAPDSVDVWAHAGLFALDPRGRPSRVAGVPPDYFSETGQRWGNPVYRWDVLAEDGYAWWVERIRANLRLVDLLRLDHFRGFAAYWEVDGAAETAADGHWEPGPGMALFDALREVLGELPLVAEDLGVITEDVESLRDDLGLPGMRVLQFAFNEPESTHRPDRHIAHAVVYTGTHDNDTLRGWYGALESSAQDRILDYLQSGGQAVVWKLIESVYRSTAELALAPLQDFLDLGSEARMNVPGTTRGNWAWRVEESALTLELAARLRELASASGRY